MTWFLTFGRDGTDGSNLLKIGQGYEFRQR